MSYTLIASASVVGNGPGTTRTTSPIDTTGANLIVVITSPYAGADTVSDSKANTLIARTQYGLSNTTEQLRYVEGPAVGSGHTFSVLGDYCGLCVAAFAGGKASSFDQENGISGSGSTVQPGSITPIEDNELIISGFGGDPCSASSIDSGMTIVENQAYSAGLSLAVAMAYKIQTAAAAINPTWTLSSSGTVAASVQSFKAGAAAAGAFIPIIGRGPGMALAGRGGLVAADRELMHREVARATMIGARASRMRERGFHVSR